MSVSTFAPSPPTQAFTTIQLPPIFGVFEGLDIPADEGTTRSRTRS